MIFEEKLKQMDTRHAVFGLLFVLSNRLEAVAGDYLGELTTKQWLFLAVLFSFFEQPPAVSEMAGAMGTSHQNVKQVALRLEKKGFVRVERDGHDARVLRVVPQEKAYRYGQEHNRENEQFLQRLFSGLSGQQVQALFESLRVLETQLKKEREEL